MAICECDKGTDIPHSVKLKRNINFAINPIIGELSAEWPSTSYSVALSKNFHGQFMEKTLSSFFNFDN